MTMTTMSVKMVNIVTIIITGSIITAATENTLKLVI